MKFHVNTNRHRMVRLMEKRANEKHLAIAAAILVQLQETTPVDTGTARDSWILMPDFSTVTVIKNIDSIGKIRSLNEGHSTQAPALFIERAIAAGIAIGSLI